jgi:hypothetical protein
MSVKPIPEGYHSVTPYLTVEGPFGHRWFISTHKEDVLLEEAHKRFEDSMKQQ